MSYLTAFFYYDGVIFKICNFGIYNKFLNKSRLEEKRIDDGSM